jgi:hypothetical protein
MTSLRRLTLGLAALLLLAWLYERRIRRETVMPRFEPQPTREWHPDRYPYLLPVHDGGSICLTDEYLEAL